MDVSTKGNLCNDESSESEHFNAEQSSESQETYDIKITEQNEFMVEPLMFSSTCTPEKQKICLSPALKASSENLDSCSEMNLSFVTDPDSEECCLSPDSSSSDDAHLKCDSFETVFGSSDGDENCSLSDHSSSILSYNSESDVDTDDTISSKDSKEDEADMKSNIPEKEHRALSLLSCFLRNQFSASASKDVIQTLKTTFKNSEEISHLDFGQMMSYVDTTPVREIHYCVVCKNTFPEDTDVFHCKSTDCDGLRYKGSLSNQENKSRQPKQSFVFADVKKQLIDLLKTPGDY